ncbi:cupin domain-containing protein [Amphritea sp. 1_MG-2023]|uniref:cupin domain-containing protein n=1 Tax=Amphritea sp. 1_MG-2023 TaxID=3062670 RepID=UPI0026E185F9|nr:cupin domain-containing protein [Amphritea sp. 1_MG-2023]MDO6564475.1 cupin domain-containing protein [Amphritea sp. 1_MG-2023]
MLNMDFTQSVTIDTRQQGWVASPKAGVWRKPLARELAEQGHATSIVRYAPGAAFSPHEHPKGEEILVLQGVFSDQRGDYPTGTYFRNPEGFSHAPFSVEGCMILVKLAQFQADDKAHRLIQTHTAPWSSVNESLDQLELHRHRDEQVCMWRSREHVNIDLSDAHQGLEIYIIQGELKENEQCFSEGVWLRRLRGNSLYQLGRDTLIWAKLNHF